MDYTTICNKVRGVSGFGSANKTTILATIQRGSSIRSIGPRRSKIYFILGQEELALEKVDRKIEETNDQVMPSISTNQENANAAGSLDSLSVAITSLLKEKPMTMEELKSRIQMTYNFEKVDTLLLLMTIYNMENVTSVLNENKKDVYFLNELKQLAVDNLKLSI